MLAPGDDPASPTVHGQNGITVEDGHVQFTVDSSANTVSGNYKAFTQITYLENAITKIATVKAAYDCIDPLEQSIVGTLAAPAIDLAWIYIEDCFDSEIGGPWLRDQTLARFDKDKIQKFLPKVLYDINMYQPITNYTAESFPYNDHIGTAIVAQGLLVNTAKHLMRSYAEQPDVTNSPAGFLNRQRYLDVWKAIYDVENEEYQRMIDEWKRLEFNKVGASVLIAGRGNRMLMGNFRSRNVIRGF